MGGVKTLKAFARPVPADALLPDGRDHADNAPDYLALPNVVCVGGSWMVSGDLARVEQLAREAQRLAAS